MHIAQTKPFHVCNPAYSSTQTTQERPSRQVSSWQVLPSRRVAVAVHIMQSIQEPLRCNTNVRKAPCHTSLGHKLATALG